ncbi:lipocalin family protein [Desulfoluna spongiiphila]|uniref:Outer membrane lipoprotein Blc n=1 Tax=Desulfoluna spongiiphila TaxID=419481 RepID=A0A1G5AJ61_9BACT|nr:lipocalin family protein [Desulfoluna spongiiphila]SCX77927.1 apolipoprotein D and lipocalin family protein [Desulfoluna spongiiphila]VVS90542.1 lipocalin apod type [Desulfoluna spongiiphila]
MKKLMFLSVVFVGLTGCLGVPDSVSPVQGFDLQRYLGTWYEIARLDHSFERGLEQVTAEYSMREDGGVRVKNRGFSPGKNQWREAEGKAFFVGEPSEGYLKVSFFGPFYGSYVIFHLDKENYGHAFVSGPDTSYLWLLSRSPSVDGEVLKAFVATSKALGFNTDELIYVNHESR